MSVKKGERKQSNIEALHVAHQIKNELDNYVFVDFGLKLEQLQSLPIAVQCELTTIREQLVSASRNIDLYVTSANSCKVVLESDLVWRRNKQQKAISACYDIEHTCMRLVEFCKSNQFEININKYYRLIQLVINEISLIRSWKNSDKSRFLKEHNQQLAVG